MHKILINLMIFDTVSPKRFIWLQIKSEGDLIVWSKLNRLPLRINFSNVVPPNTCFPDINRILIVCSKNKLDWFREIGDSGKKTMMLESKLHGRSPSHALHFFFFSYLFYKPTLFLLITSIRWSIAPSLFISSHLACCFPSWSNASLVSVASPLPSLFLETQTSHPQYQPLWSEHLKYSFVWSQQIKRPESRNKADKSRMMFFVVFLYNSVFIDVYAFTQIDTFLLLCTGDGHSGQRVSFFSLIPLFVS